MRTAIIPFSGFYESTHDAALDDALHSMFQDDCGDATPAYDIASDAIDWRAAHIAYARLYADWLASECNATWQFDEMNSPRFYNYETDQIRATITLAELQRMQSSIDRADWLALCEERLTARSGFIPFYSSNPDTWGELHEWEAPQLGLLVECYCNAYCDEQHRAWELVDDCNGDVSRCIESAIPQSAWDKINALEAVA
jgi:hypothetical protein